MRHLKVLYAILHLEGTPGLWQDLGHNKLGIRAQIFKVLGCLWSIVCRFLFIGMKNSTSINGRLQHLGNISLPSYSFSFDSVQIYKKNLVCACAYIFEIMPPSRGVRGHPSIKKIWYPRSKGYQFTRSATSWRRRQKCWVLECYVDIKSCYCQ